MGFVVLPAPVLQTVAPTVSRRSRQRRAPGGRQKKHTVRVSPHENQMIEARARMAGVSVPRLLVESALAGDERTASEHRALVAELLGVRRLVAALGNNLNQLTKVANASGDIPTEASPTLHAVARAMARLEAAVAELQAPDGDRW